MNSLQTIIDEVSLRWNAPIEGFFKPIYRASLILLTLCAAVVFVQSTLVDLNLHVPNWLTIAAGVAGTVGTFLSGMTIDREKLKLREKIGLAKSRMSDLKSPWYITFWLVLAHVWACLGWILLSVLVAGLAYRPVFWLINRYVNDKEARRSNARYNRKLHRDYLIRKLGNHGTES